MVHSGYHPLKDRPVRIVFGWCTVDIILLNRPVRISLDGAPSLKDRPIRIVFGWCTVDIILLRSRPLQDSVWIVHSGYHPLKDRPLRIVFGWCTVDIILLRIVLSG